MLIFGGLWNFAQENQLNALIMRAGHDILLALGRTIVLRIMHPWRHSLRILETGKDFNNNWVRGCTCYILTNNMAARHLCPKN